MCCVNAFAAAPASVPFQDNFNIYEFIPFGIPSSQYTTSVSSVGTGTNIKPSTDGVYPDSFAYSFRVAAIASDGYITKNSNISGTFNFEILLPISDPSDLKTKSLLLYDVSTQNFWGLTYKTKFSDVQFLEKIETYDYGTKWRCTADFSYTNNTDEAINADNVSFQFYFALPDTAQVPAEYIVATFNMSVDDYYFGSTSDPYGPGYSPPSDDGFIDDYQDKENEIFDGAQDGLDKFGEIVGDLGDSIYFFSNGLQSVSRSISYILGEWSFLVYILYVSLALGILTFVLNLGGMIFKGLFRKGD